MKLSYGFGCLHFHVPNIIIIFALIYNSISPIQNSFLNFAHILYLVKCQNNWYYECLCTKSANVNCDDSQKRALFNHFNASKNAAPKQLIEKTITTKTI